MTLAQELLGGALVNGGATLHPYTEHQPFGGYMVGIGRERKILLATASVAEVERYVRESIRHFAETAGAWPAATYLGSWVDDGYLYLDIAEHVHNRDAALVKAHVRGELAIFDVTAQAEIRLEDEDIF